MNRILSHPRGLFARFVPAAALLALASAAGAQTLVQPISPTAGLPTITYAFNHTSVASIAGTAYDFNYYDFTISGFHNVGAGNPTYDIFSFSNTTLEKEPTVVAVISSYLPQGWTFSDTNDFVISTGPARAIHADDPDFGLIFIQTQGAAPIVPDTPFMVYHQDNAVDPFVYPDGSPVLITPTAAVPEASTTLSFGLLLTLGMGGLLVASRRRKAAVSGRTRPGL